MTYYALLCLFSFDFVFEQFVFPAFILVLCVRVFGSPGRCACGHAVHIVCRGDRFVTQTLLHVVWPACARSARKGYATCSNPDTGLGFPLPFPSLLFSNEGLLFR